MGMEERQMRVLMMTSNVDLWHKRLSHASESKLKHVSVLCSFSRNFKGRVCDSCVKVKHTRLSFPKSSIKTNGCFELIHCDVWGKCRTPTHKGVSYFHTIVDDYSRALWVYLLKYKSDAVTCLMNFHNMVRT